VSHSAHSKIRAPILILAFFGICAETNSQDILALGIGGDVNRFDPESGAWSTVGSTGVVYGNWTSISQDSQGRIFAANGYWNLPYRIYEIDPSTGLATLQCQTQLFGINALAFGPGDLLYAANDRTAPTIPHPYDLHEIDLVTGSTNLIGAIGVNGLASMDFHSGMLWAYDHDIGLMTIDPVSAVGTDVNPHFRGPADLAESICFGPDGQLFQMDAGLWVMDTITGVPCLVGLTGYLGFIVGIEFITGPNSPFTLGTKGQTGSPMGIEVWGAAAFSTVVLLGAQGGGGPTAVGSGHPCAGTVLDLNANHRLVDLIRTDGQGHARFGPAFVPAGAAGSLRLQALNLASCRTSNLARVIY